MKCFVTIFLFFFTISSSFAETNILEPKSCFEGPFESYGKWLDLLKSKKKNFNEDKFLHNFPESKFNQRKLTLECVDFKYQVDNVTVEGFYVKPRKTASSKRPVIIYNRGGNAGFGYVVFGKKMDFISDIAAKGYIVIGSQYRGASARLISENGKDEFGGQDVNDVLRLVDLIQEIPDADTSKIALLGWSRGAMQSYLASKHMPDVRTIIAIAGNSDVRRALEWRPAMKKVYKARVPNFENNKVEELSKRSVVDWVDKLPSSPILLIHGTNDKRVNFEQSTSFSEVLTRQNHPHKLVIYEGDNHGLVRNREKLVSEVNKWLLQYM